MQQHKWKKNYFSFADVELWHVLRHTFLCDKNLNKVWYAHVKTQRYQISNLFTRNKCRAQNKIL
jgi:hypothetical protein